MPKLHELAHCRAGDKGNTSILSLIAYRAEDYPLLEARVTVDAVARHLRGIVEGDIRRFELPALWALQFVCSRSLSGGVTTPRSGGLYIAHMGSGTWQVNQVYTTQNNVVGVQLVDFDGSGYLDIVSNTEYQQNSITLWKNELGN